MKRLKLIILCLICLFWYGRSFSQNGQFITVAPPKEAAWLGITGITQDLQGYIWLATFNGLYKYDGHNYTIYNHNASNPNSLSVAELEDVYADKDGMIWIATYRGGLDRLDPLTNTFTHYRHQPKDKNSLADDRVSCIIKDRDGLLWIGTNSGLEQFDPKTGIFKHFAHNDKDLNSLSNNQVRIVYEDRTGTIWAGTGSVFPGDETPKGSGGLNKLNKKTGKFTRYLHNDKDPNSLTDNRIQAIFEDSRGVFWVGTAGDGLYTMNRADGTFQHYSYDPKHPEKLSRPPVKNDPGGFNGDHITFINEDVSGKIWIGTYDNGINVYDPKSQKCNWYGADRKSNVKTAANHFWRAYKSRDGILWIVPWETQELYKINPYQNKLPHINTGIRTFDFIEDSNNDLWLATIKGLYFQNTNNTTGVFYTDKKIPHNKDVILKMERDGDNSLWLGTIHGLYRFDPLTKVFNAFHKQKENKNSLASDTVIFLIKGRAGKLWIGTDKGLSLMDTKARTFINFKNDKKDTSTISNNAIYSIALDKSGNVWAGTPSGLNRLDQKTMRVKRYMTGTSIFSVFKDNKGDLWTGTADGLFKYNASNDKFSVIDNQTTMAVYAVTEDDERNFWLNTAIGIEKFSLKDRGVQIYGLSQGVDPTIVTNWGYKRHNGEILYGDTLGYFEFQPDKLLHQTPPPTVSINKFFLGAAPVLPAEGGIITKPVYDTKEIKLNHSQSTFSFGFTSIDYINPEEDNRLYYTLQNYDSGWLSAGMNESANYFNVPPGNYIFKIKSVNTNGLVTQKQINIIVTPPWWQTWWAYTLFALLFAGSIWAFIYYRSLSLLKEKRVLEHKVQIRTEEVIQQKEEIEAQRDDLEKAFSELKHTQNQLIQSEKMASLGELTAGIAHEIQNPLNFVNNFSEVSIELASELKDDLRNGKVTDAIAIAEDLEQNLGKINHHGKRADFIVKGMLQHSRTGRGERQLTNINILADEFFKLSYHGLRAKEKSFNAEMVTNFDPELPKVNVIQQDIGRVLLNLYNNAFYAVDQKAKTADASYKPEVTVTTAPQPPPTSGEAKAIIITVKDNGIGIPDAIKDKIMQPFFTTKPTGEGTGLGLSLTYDMVVKGHDGTITVNTKEGEGSEFIIMLPLS